MMAPGAIRHLFYTPGARAITGAVTQFFNYFIGYRADTFPRTQRVKTFVYFNSCVSVFPDHVGKINVEHVPCMTILVTEKT
jgi:hypothetical protein